MANWINIKQRKPKNGEEVLVVVDGHRGPAWSNTYCQVAYRSEYDGNFYEERHQQPVVGVTHWMPLPKMP